MLLRAVRMLAGCSTLYRGQRAGAFGCTLKYGLVLLSVLSAGWMVRAGQWFSGLVHWGGIVESDCLRLLLFSGVWHQQALAARSLSRSLPSLP